MHKILVTGSEGFLGKEIVQELIDQGYLVDGLDTLKTSIFHSNYNGFHSDIVSFFKRINVAKYKAIIHLAAESRATLSDKKPSLFLKENIINVIEILEAIKKNKKKPLFIFAGSLNARKNSKKENSYLISKYTGEKIVKFYSQQFNIKCAVLILSDLYSTSNLKSERFLYKCIRFLKSNKKINITDKNHSFRFFNIKNLRFALNKIFKSLNINSFIEVHCYAQKNVNILDLVKNIKNKTNSKSKIIISRNNKIKNNKVNKILLTKNNNIFSDAYEVFKKINL